MSRLRIARHPHDFSKFSSYYSDTQNSRLLLRLVLYLADLANFSRLSAAMPRLFDIKLEDIAAKCMPHSTQELPTCAARLGFLFYYFLSFRWLCRRKISEIYYFLSIYIEGWYAYARRWFRAFTSAIVYAPLIHKPTHFHDVKMLRIHKRMLASIASLCE